MVLLWVWVPLDESLKSRFTYIAARIEWCSAYLSFSLGSQNEDACYLLYWTFDQAFYPCRIGTNHPLCADRLRSNSWAAAGQQLPYRTQIYIHYSYLVQLHNPSRVGQKSVLFGNTLLDKAKKIECSTGTTANKDRNYIDNSSSLSPSLIKAFRRTVWRTERRPHLLVDGAFIVYPKESNLSIPRWPSFVDRIFNEWKEATLLN